MQQTRKHFNPIEVSKYPPPTAKNPWCVRFPVGTSHEATAKARLIVFCHAGGNSAYYRPWDALVPPEISLIVIELPGRLTRFKDPVISDLQTIVKQSVEQGLVSYLDRPFFLFGHSFGSKIAFEVARYLQKNYNISPIAVFNSSHISPITPITNFSHTLPDKELIDTLITKYGDVNLEKVRREYPDLLAMVTPAIKADMTAGEKYVYYPAPGLQCPIIFFAGKDERLTSKDAQDWKAQSAVQDKFEEHWFPGGHFYFQEDLQGFFAVFNGYLKKFLLEI